MTGGELVNGEEYELEVVRNTRGEAVGMKRRNRSK